jgi:hypothetical protein
MRIDSNQPATRFPYLLPEQFFMLEGCRLGLIRKRRGASRNRPSKRARGSASFILVACAPNSERMAKMVRHLLLSACAQELDVAF